MDILDRLRRCTRPVVFETEIDRFACSTAGTAFIVAFEQSLFVVTAEHVVKDWPIEKVLVYPSWTSPYTFRYLNWWRVETIPEDHEASDLLIIKVDFNDIPVALRKDIIVLDLNNSDNVSWYDERHDSQFFLCGFPTHGNDGVDYSTLEIKTSQYFLAGSYEGFSIISPLCHTIKLENPLNLPHFSGLSGSPVFSHRPEGPPKFCGLALRGTAASGLIHFLKVEVLIEALTDIQKQTTLRKEQ